MHATRLVWQNLQMLNGPAPDLVWAGCELPPIVTQVLHSRGVPPSKLDGFLGTRRGPVHSPQHLRGMPEAVSRILRARQDHELVAIYGDADVDGMTAVALLVQAFSTIGVNVIPYVPDRHVEVAGVSLDALNLLARRGVRLVVTADCGVASARELGEARAFGLEFVITDHHEPPAQLPDVAAVVDPLQQGCRYPCKHLAGVGVAFKLAQALYAATGVSEDRARSLLDLVALGTIADMVPLIDENRALVWQGLAVLNRCERPGLHFLVTLSGLQTGTIATSDLAYKLCPRLNAAGRFEQGSLGYALLAAKTYEEAEIHAGTLDLRYRERQTLAQQVYEACAAKLARGPIGQQDRLIVVHIEPSAASVAGVVAGKLVEDLGLPVMVLQESAGIVRGTLRGTPAFPIIEALHQNSGLLSHYGGHQHAAGFVTTVEHAEQLAQRVGELADRAISPAGAFPELRIDAEVSLHAVDWTLYEQLGMLEPFGVGNPMPVLLCKRLRLVDFKCVGNNHLQLIVRRGRTQLSAIAFRQGSLAHQLCRNQEIDLVFSMEVNEWDGRRTLQLRVRDLAFDPAFAGVP